MHASKPTAFPELRPSRIPVAVGIFSIALSAGLVVFGAVIGFPTVLLVVPRVELQLPQQWWIGLIGWILTPLLVMLALVWDSVSQRARAADPDFTPNLAYPRLLKVICIVGFVISVWHVLTIAVPLIEIVQGVS